MSYKRIVLGTVLFSSLFLFIPGSKVEASETNNIEKTAAINTGEVSGVQTASEKTAANDAEKEKQVASLDLSTLKDGNNNTSEVQTYKTKVVTLDNGEQGLQIGETEPDEDAGALEENMWLNVNGRGMVNLSFKTEPNCKYRLTFDAQRVQNSKAKAPSAQYGLFAAEASAENREVPGSVG